LTRRHAPRHELRIRGGHQGDAIMRDPARGCLAGLISWKLGGGLFSTIILFILIYMALKNC
jgi:hypothetical protein